MLFGRKSKRETPQISRPVPQRAPSSEAANAHFYRPHTAQENVTYEDVLGQWNTAHTSTASSIYPSAGPAPAYGRPSTANAPSYSQAANLSRQPTLVRHYFAGLAERHRTPIVKQSLQTKTRKPVRQVMWLWRGTLRNCKDAGRLNKQERELWDLAREEGVGKDLQRAVNECEQTRLYDPKLAFDIRYLPTSTPILIPSSRPFRMCGTPSDLPPSAPPPTDVPSSRRHLLPPPAHTYFSKSSDGSDFLPSTTLTNRFRNFYRMATGSMSPTGQSLYWSDADARYSATDCARCERQRDYLLQYSPIVTFMLSNIRRLGGDLNKSNIRCRTCSVGQLGGFDHKYGVMLCANYVQSQSMLEDVMAHEMVHAWDTLRFKTDLSADADLRHVACSEIRASNLSGECRWANEFFKNGIMRFTKHQEECVRRRAVISVKNRPNCKDDVEAVKVVNSVWDSCFRDTRPFDEIYR